MWFCFNNSRAVVIDQLQCQPWTPVWDENFPLHFWMGQAVARAASFGCNAWCLDFQQVRTPCSIGIRQESGPSQFAKFLKSLVLCGSSCSKRVLFLGEGVRHGISPMLGETGGKKKSHQQSIAALARLACFPSLCVVRPGLVSVWFALVNGRVTSHKRPSVQPAHALPNTKKNLCCRI